MNHTAPQAGLPDEKQQEESKEEEAKEQSQAELDRALFDASRFEFFYDRAFVTHICFSSSGDLSEVERLLALNADPNSKHDADEETPLHASAENGHLDCLAALIRAARRSELGTLTEKPRFPGRLPKTAPAASKS